MTRPRLFPAGRLKKSRTHGFGVRRNGRERGTARRSPMEMTDDLH